MKKLIIVTGLSGSGKSVAIRQLEDSGYYCIDNLPLPYLVQVAQDLGKTQDCVAFSVDARTHVVDKNLPQKIILELKQNGWDVRILFLTASTLELIQRFSETRRRHPLTFRLSKDHPNISLSQVIDAERDLLEPFSVFSDVLDTTNLQSNTLRTWVKNFADAPQADLTLNFESFGYKHGIPFAADLVFDVRNLPNPYYVPELRTLTGKDAPIIEYMKQQPMVSEMIKDITQFIDKWLPSYMATNRQYLTIAIGCTGGQHRSVYVAEQLAQHFQKRFNSIGVRHRIIGQKIPPTKGSAQTH